jgi:protein-L-isoaspartate(D-aspartate) O-methyltransferase
MPRPRALVGCLATALLLAGCGERESAPPSAGPAPSPPAATASVREPPALRSRKGERAEERDAMVRSTIAARGVGDRAVLAALHAVPRHLFVPPQVADEAYDDRPLPIGHGQTISQPYIVASMTEHARVGPGSRVLEIGTGSGYQAAVLAEITPEVFTIEIKAPLAEQAARTLAGLGYASVRARRADGWHGWPEEAPFDAILVTAATGTVPPPLVRQLKPGGRMVVPVGPAYATQALTLVEKDAEGRVRTETLYPVRFVPLTREDEERGDGESEK